MVGICRLCATIRKENLLNAITEEVENINNKLLDCCRIKISAEDNLPKTICLDCVHSLNFSHEFYMKVQQSQESLKALFPTYKINNKYDDKELSVVVLNADDSIQEYIHEFMNDDMQSIDEHSDSHNSEEDNDEHIVLKYTENIDSAEKLHEYSKGMQNIEYEQEDEQSIMEEYLDEEVNEQHIIESVNDWSACSWLCYICAESFPNYEELVKHAEQLHQVKAADMLYRCADCHKNCTQYFNFINHVRFHHHTQLTMCCDICNLHFSEMKEFAQHRNYCNHPKQPNYLVICPKCGKAFRNYNAQHFHERIQHVTMPKEFNCQQCNKKFKRLFTLRTHERVHSAAKHFSCEICGKAFRQKINLDMHMYAHSEQKEFECAICKKCFKTAANLDKHGLTHTDIRKFKCQYCAKEFRTNDAKTQHERIHTGEMPFKCEYCGKSFRFRSTFSSHLNLHTGVRPYVCIDCDHHFTNWSNYNKHMKRKHANKL